MHPTLPNSMALFEIDNGRCALLFHIIASKQIGVKTLFILTYKRLNLMPLVLLVTQYQYLTSFVYLLFKMGLPCCKIVH